MGGRGILRARDASIVFESKFWSGLGEVEIREGGRFVILRMVSQSSRRASNPTIFLLVKSLGYWRRYFSRAISVAISQNVSSWSGLQVGQGIKPSLIN